MIRLGQDIFWIGMNDRSTDLFEGIWPLPNGISYNSYLINDRKKVLIDSVKESYGGQLIDEISKLVEPSELDYVVVNHMEPDHSGTLRSIRRLAPEVEFIGTSKTKDMLKSYYGITEGIRVINDGEELDLGDKTLRFYETPFVHWPETMMTYLSDDGILFSCDAFGSFGVLNGGIFDDELDISEYETESLRYFSNIVGTYTATVQVALKKLADLDIETIAPSHGPIWRENPEYIVDAYDRWSKMEGESGVTLVYGSMYGNTLKAAEEIVKGLRSAGCENFKMLDASRNHRSFLLAEAWRRKGLIVGAPTYDSGIYLPVKKFMDLLRKKQLKNRISAFFGSYGWGGGALKGMKSISEDLRWEVVSELEFEGSPGKEIITEAEKMGRTVAKKIMS